MLRVGINVSFKMVPDFPKLTRHSPSYSESTDLLANFPCFFFLILMHCQPQDKGPTTESEAAYLVTLKSNLVDLFKLVYDLISDRCKRDDQGRHVYEPQPTESPASKSSGCYKVHVAGGNNKGRVKTG